MVILGPLYPIMLYIKTEVKVLLSRLIDVEINVSVIVNSDGFEKKMLKMQVLCCTA